MTLAPILALLLLAADPEVEAATLVIDETQHFTESHASVLRLERDGQPVSGVAVQAKYRQNALTTLQETQDIGKTDANGQVTWTPTQAGVVVLAWDGGSENVAVRYDGAPGLGIVVMILAGVLLLGGTFSFFLQMLRGTN